MMPKLLTFSAHTRTVLTRLPGRPTDAGGIELPPLPPLTEDDLAFLKQGVGDKSGRPQATRDAAGESGEEGGVIEFILSGSGVEGHAWKDRPLVRVRHTLCMKSHRISLLHR